VLEEEVAAHGDFGGEHLLQELAAQRDRIPAFEREVAAADLVLVGSRFAASTVQADLDRPEAVSVVPYNAPTPQTEPFERPARNEVTILHAGSISAHKGVQYLLEALRKLGNPRLKLLLVGHIAADRRALAAYGDLFTHVPHVPRTELPTIYNSADIFVLASLAEGFGRSLIEAAAHGLPLICTTATGGDHLVGEEAAGFLVSPRDVDALAQRIDQLASDRDLRLRMGHEAWRRAQDFTFEAYRRRLAQALAVFHPST
jgi:glycosyltransferase involved in cell wall biosynthesis